MKLSIMAAAAAALVTTSFAAAPADAQRGGRDGMRERTVVRTTVVHRDNGHHYGWRNNRHRKVRVCRTVWRHHHRSQVCTWRYR
jgi:Ni/Co efflux regulator RcnB